jgi:hypothetical protein
MTILQVEFGQPIKRCRSCGQLIRQRVSNDPIGAAILDVLHQANGNLVKMNVLIELSGLNIDRQTAWRRCDSLEKQGLISRDKQHPKSGWKYNHRQEMSIAA